MKNQSSPLALAFAFTGLSLAAAGCILGKNPNENERVFNSAVAGTTGSAGGSTGAGGAGGTNLDTIPGFPVATFDAGDEAFTFSNYPEASNLFTNNGGTPPTIMVDTSDASPTTGGSLKVFAPYSGANQYVDVQSPAATAATAKNWVGGKLHVRVKVDAGSTFAGQIEPYVDTTPGSFFFVGTSLNVVPGGGWHDYVVTLDSAMTRTSGYDLKQVILYGVHIGSGSAGGSQGPVTFHIDSFSIEGVTAPVMDAGRDTGTGADSASDLAAATDTSSDDTSGN